MEQLNMNLMKELTLPLWQIIGASYLLFSIGGGFMYLYLVHFLNDSKAKALVLRKNAAKAWGQFLIAVVVIPGIASIILMLLEVGIAVWRAVEENFEINPIPTVFIYSALAAIAVVILIAVVAFVRSKFRRTS